jgi:UDP-N-acetylmuramate--alanine ligase
MIDNMVGGKFSFGNSAHAHLIGAGGINMSGVAELLSVNGLKVTGSDARESALTDRLNRLGVKVAAGHGADNIPPEADTVIYTAAVKPDNPELIEAKRRGLKILERSEALGLIMDNYARPVCIAGTHGKTTVTAMLSVIALKAGLDPTLMIGGVLPEIGGAFKAGGRDALIAEACEYCDSFLKFKPRVAVILNIEKDHTDYFKDLAHIRESFAAFAALPPENGAVVINGAIERRREITRSAKGRVVTFCGDGADWAMDGLSFDALGRPSFTAAHKSGKTPVSLACCGEHNAKNAMAAIAAAHELGISPGESAGALSGFTGAQRRFQKLGVMKNGAAVVDDYAHHPTEVKAAIAAARAGGKVWVAFQSHTKERTKEQMAEFSAAFDGADEIIILDIYLPAGREWEAMDVTGEELAENVKNRGKSARFIKTFAEARRFIEENAHPDDLVIVMGAGDVFELGNMLVKR